MRNTPRERGFTLIELMVVLAIVGILLAIAVPAYGSLVRKSQVRTAQADLAALAANAENVLQRTLAYPTGTVSTNADVKTLFPGWVPAQEANFIYGYAPFPDPVTARPGYRITASWAGAAPELAGCILTMTNTNTKTLSDGCKEVMGGVTTW